LAVSFSILCWKNEKKRKRATCSSPFHFWYWLYL